MKKIAMVGPSMSSCEHTLNTLRYADRVKELAVGGLSDAEPVLDPGPCVVVKDESDSNLDSISVSFSFVSLFDGFSLMLMFFNSRRKSCRMRCTHSTMQRSVCRRWMKRLLTATAV